MGKTTIVYAIVKILKSKALMKRALVIAPIKPMYNVWPNQCHAWKEFDDLKVIVCHGPSRVQSLLADGYDVHVINPEGLEWAMAYEKQIRERFDILVVDESTKFKNTTTQRFKRIKNLIKWFRRRYILTGSFSPNGLEDLFGQVYVLDEGASLGRFITHYRKNYFYPDYMGYNWTPHPWAAEKIAEKIAPLTLVLEREGNINLPELLPPNDIFVELPAESRKKYAEMEGLMIAAIEEDKIIAANAAVATSKCRQIANGFIFDEEKNWHNLHDAKIEAVQDLVDQLSGEPLLLVYEFIPDLEKLKKAFPNATWLTSGNAKRDEMAIQIFCAGKAPVGLAQVTSISLGIDGLQKSCSNICMYALTWNLEAYSQTIDRVWRTGNPSKIVSLHRIIAKDTVDEVVIARLAGKDLTQTEFLKLLKSMRS